MLYTITCLELSSELDAFGRCQFTMYWVPEDYNPEKLTYFSRPRAQVFFTNPEIHLARATEDKARIIAFGREPLEQPWAPLCPDTIDDVNRRWGMVLGKKVG